jgi:isopentenyl diphosphate isomerase/L-lactate dehydrogenase-like FMN-dependent dehydrogenase
VRRATIAIGILAILASSCGDPAIDPAVATTLENRVTNIRRLAENLRPRLATAAAEDLMVFVDQRLEAGRIDEGKAMEIIEAAQLVILRLELLPQPSPTASPLPPPTEEDEGGEGKPDEEEKDEKPGKGNGNGDGNEGHGND